MASHVWGQENKSQHQFGLKTNAMSMIGWFFVYSALYNIDIAKIEATLKVKSQHLVFHSCKGGLFCTFIVFPYRFITQTLFCPGTQCGRGAPVRRDPGGRSTRVPGQEEVHEVPDGVPHGD